MDLTQAPADKKAEATAALLSKLVEQRTALHQKVRDLVDAADSRGAKAMGCEMMETED
jgi:hypothetical protein